MYICRFGRQDFADVLGRQPTALDWALFHEALIDILAVEYEVPSQLRQED